MVALVISASGVKDLAGPRSRLGPDQLDNYQLNQRDVSVACDSIEQAGGVVRPPHRLDGETITQHVYLCRMADSVLPMVADDAPAPPIEGRLVSLYSSEITWPDAFKRDRAMFPYYLQVRTDNLIGLVLSLLIGAVAFGFVAMWSLDGWRRWRRRTA